MGTKNGILKIAVINFDAGLKGADKRVEWVLDSWKKLESPDILFICEISQKWSRAVLARLREESKEEL